MLDESSSKIDFLENEASSKNILFYTFSLIFLGWNYPPLHLYVLLMNKKSLTEGTISETLITQTICTSTSSYKQSFIFARDIAKCWRGFVSKSLCIKFHVGRLIEQRQETLLTGDTTMQQATLTNVWQQRRITATVTITTTARHQRRTRYIHTIYIYIYTRAEHATSTAGSHIITVFSQSAPL